LKRHFQNVAKPQTKLLWIRHQVLQIIFLFFWGAAGLKRLGTRPEPLSYTLLLSLTELLIALLLTVIALKFLQYQLL